MILVAIVEDDSTIRKALEEFIELQDNMKCIYSAESMETFFRNLNENNLPDVVLIDIGLPGMSGISGLKIIGEKYPEINSIVLTVYQDSHKIFQSLRAGASAYLLKNVPFREIREVISMVHRGGSFMSPPIARKVIEYFQDTPHHPDKTPLLTSKEKEIVMGLVDGMTYNKIAERSFISVETVRSHIKNIYKKLHVHSKAEVIRKSLNGEI
jgi:DNA-binding NarL/FixJ family response regulator